MPSTVANRMATQKTAFNHVAKKVFQFKDQSNNIVLLERLNLSMQKIIKIETTELVELSFSPLSK